MNIRRVISIITLFATLISPLSVDASPLYLDLTLRVTSANGYYGFDPSDFTGGPKVGDKYRITLTIDKSVLDVDGISRPGKVLAFDANIGPTQWNSTLPRSGDEIGNVFSGFRGPCIYLGAHCSDAELEIWGPFSEYLGFDVYHGEIVGIRGGVFGPADFPFIDFNGAQYGSASLFSFLRDSMPPFSAMVYTTGSLSVDIPEPPSIMLLLLGAGAAISVRNIRAKTRARFALHY